MDLSLSDISDPQYKNINILKQSGKNVSDVEYKS